MNQFKIKEISVVFYNESKQFIYMSEEFLCKDILIPDNARYFKYYFPNNDFADFTNQTIMLRIGEVSENSYVQNSTIHHCRRQGVSIGGARNSGVTNCMISDIKGTAPQSCIDIEDGGHSTEHIIIENNIFKNSIYGLICYDGTNHVVRNNYFEKCNLAQAINASIGVIIDSCVYVQGSVSISVTNETYAYEPKQMLVNNCAFIDNKNIDIVGNITVDNCSFKNTNLIRIKNGVKLYNSSILRELNFTYQFNFIDIRIVNCKINTRGNNSYAMYNIVDCFIDNLISEDNTTLYIGGNTKIYNSKINAFGYYGSGDSNIHFQNTTLGLTKNPFRASTTGGHIFKIYFDKCIYNQFSNYVYGLMDINDGMFIKYENCTINNVGTSYLFRTYGIKTNPCEIELINCEINSDTINTKICNDFAKVKYLNFNNNILTNVILPDRPILDENSVGYIYYDKTDSKLVLWDGDKWIEI